MPNQIVEAKMIKNFVGKAAISIALFSGAQTAANAGYIVDFIATGEPLRCAGGAVLVDCSTLDAIFTPLPAGTILASFYSYNDGPKNTFRFIQSSGNVVESRVSPLAFDAATTRLSGALVLTSSNPVAVPGFSNYSLIFDFGNFFESFTTVGGVSSSTNAGIGMCPTAVQPSSTRCSFTSGTVNSNVSSFTGRVRPFEVPLPASAALVGLGLIGLFGLRKSR
jgi:hypothetical protein